jgi:hypothetical protein
MINSTAGGYGEYRLIRMHRLKGIMRLLPAMRLEHSARLYPLKVATL